MKKALRYNVILKPELAGGFTAIVPSLPSKGMVLVMFLKISWIHFMSGEGKSKK